MLRSLYTASTGMIAQQQNLDVISNNLANVNTTGFKGQRAEFEDLVYQTMRSSSGGDNGIPQGVQIGLGTKLSATSGQFTQGSMLNTGNPLNMAIQGDGFFKVTRADGSDAYTRDGTFKMDGAGKVVTSEGLSLNPPINLDPKSTAVTIKEDGGVYAVLPGASSATFVGQVELTSVANPAGMARIGGNLYLATDASGTPVSGKPGENGTGTVQSGYVEGSNVQVVEEMVHMITAQRAYEINSKAIQTADDMLSIVNGLKR